MTCYLTCGSRPSWARGLKLSAAGNLAANSWSRPSWARGLKPNPDESKVTTSQSRPSWARGLKLFYRLPKTLPPHVASLVGAWIETIQHAHRIYRGAVASLVGAWIETLGFADASAAAKVASLVGAWIETLVCLTDRKSYVSRVPRGRVD